MRDVSCPKEEETQSGRTAASDLVERPLEPARGWLHRRQREERPDDAAGAWSSEAACVDHGRRPEAEGSETQRRGRRRRGSALRGELVAQEPGAGAEVVAGGFDDSGPRGVEGRGPDRADSSRRQRVRPRRERPELQQRLARGLPTGTCRYLLNQREGGDPVEVGGRRDGRRASIARAPAPRGSGGSTEPVGRWHWAGGPVAHEDLGSQEWGSGAAEEGL